MTLDLLILGGVIGSNNFATALALGSLGQRDRQWRILTVFALFEFCVPLAGLWLGARVSGLLAGGLGWLGPALIAALGLWTLRNATGKGHDTHRLGLWLASWRGLVGLAAIMSLDNLVVGFGLGFGGVPALLAASVIMLCSVVFAWIGLQIGARVRRDFQGKAEAGSGLLLIALAAADWLGWL